MSTLVPEPIPWDGLTRSGLEILDESNTLDWENITNTTEFHQAHRPHLLILNDRGSGTDIEIPVHGSPTKVAGTITSSITETIASGDVFALAIEPWMSQFIINSNNQIEVNVNETLNLGVVTHSGTDVSISSATTATDSTTRNEGQDISGFTALVDVGYDITANGNDTVTATLRVTPLNSNGNSTGSTIDAQDTALPGNSDSGILTVEFDLPANTEQIQMEVEILIDGGGDGADTGTEGNIGDLNVDDLESDINDERVTAEALVSRRAAK